MTTGRAKALTWTGIGLCVAGALGLLVGAVLDVEAADPWASVAGGAAALIGLALVLYGLLQGASGGTSVTAGGTRSVAAGGSIGTVSTGDGPATPPPAPPATPPSPGPAVPRTVTASGERAIAAGGDIGSASTGDGPGTGGNGTSP
ncbi:hypothetical protein [Streptomyces dubilierae]|uniref:Uncharacterized protein n=1 Tax=Streptomyces dubilierae TaxID=3075533 RepID=A0ABU2P3F9_9ACTN|nr:hypothetical protein [Streptomyces sp. DSM 41921]MDT0385880.1 hypothetical protein [Streptomyces sp. DSM 41921]